jgi:hypothetical protein
MEAEKTKYLIEIERQRVLEKEAETKRKQVVIAAQTEAEVSQIKKEQELFEYEAKKKIQDLENKIYMEKEKTIADAENYRIQKEIEANNRRLTPAYLDYLRILHLSNNTKLYFGESLPKFISSNILTEK